MTFPRPHRLTIFDCDGVLVDSEPIANQVLAALVSAEGLPMDAEDAEQAFTGATMDAVIETLETRLAHPLRADFLACYLDALHARLARELAPIDGIEAVLSGLSGPRCVASNGEPETTWLSLRVTGLLGHFAPHVYNAKQAGRGKPHPDLFLYAAERMACPAAGCIVVEDSVRGITAARAAGMHAIGYAPDEAGTADALRAAGAHRVVSDVAALPPLLLQCD